MSNLPLGADNDPFAPYNIKEESFQLSVSLLGTAWYEYYGNLDIEEAVEFFKEKIKRVLSNIVDMDINLIDVSLL